MDQGRLRGLSGVQVAGAEQVRDRWVRAVVDTGPADRAAAQDAVRRVYAAAGLPGPAHVVWLDSPLAGVLACGLLTVPLRERLLTTSALARQVWQQLRNQVGPELGVTVTGARVRRLVADDIVDVAYRRIEETVTTRVERWIDEVIRQPVADAVTLIADPVDEELERAVRQLVPSDLVSWVLRGGVTDSVPGPAACVRLALVDYLCQVAPAYRQAHAAAVEGHFAVAESAGWWWPFRTLVILTDRPRLQPTGERSSPSPADWRLHYTDGFTALLATRQDGATVAGGRVVVASPRALPPPPSVAAPWTPPESTATLCTSAHPAEDADGFLGRLRELIVDHDLEIVAELLLASVRPSLLLTPAPVPGDPARATKLGGRPGLPSPGDWPSVRGPLWRRRHLPFVGQLNLADVTPRAAVGLPQAGVLSFFVDIDTYLSTGQGFAVRYFPDPDRLSDVPTPPDVPAGQRYREVQLSMMSTWTLPDVDSDATPAVTDTDDDWHDDYIALHAELADDENSPHRVLGHPDLMQGRLPGDPDHVLLLQVSDDETVGNSWAAPGRLYFTIQPDDLRHRRWERVALHLQVG